MVKGTRGFEVIGRENIKSYILNAVYEKLDSIPSILELAADKLFDVLWGNLADLRDCEGLGYNKEAIKRFVRGAFSDSSFSYSHRISKIFDELTREGKIVRYLTSGNWSYYCLPEK